LTKLIRARHLRTAMQQATGQIARVAQAAADDIAGLDARKVDRSEIDAIVDRIHAEIFGGEVAATLCSQEGEAIAAQDGEDLNAVRKTKKGGG